MSSRARAGALVLAGAAALAAACRSQQPAVGTQPAPTPAPARAADAGGPGRPARALPDTAGRFGAGPLQVADGYVRRRYQRGAASVEITVAERPQAPGEYEDWLAQSRDYPQAPLPVPRDVANGFYTCAGPGTDGPCDLHVQTRAGFHVEVLGGGHATRADLDELVARLPLAALTD
jgi:hypothetical protein